MSQTQRKITATDLLAYNDYTARRAEFRKTLVPLKKNRRVEVGPIATFFFENYETMWHQVQEMLHIEKGGDEQIPGELETYNPLIPQGSELIATLMLQVEDEKRRDAVLKTLGGIEETIAIDVGGERVKGTPTEYEDRTTPDGKTSSVHWIRFVFTPQQIAKFKKGERAVIEIAHKNYGHMAVMPEAAQQALAGDFV